ncbi:MAG: HU family DNA-binding protein [Myxococcota bacterium]|nr:HU family DNA-binding protein [Myxococcota bacterium]
MTKNDLVNQIAAAAGIKKAQAELALGAMTDGIRSALVNGDKVTLVGFGTFNVSERAARKGRNPQTKEVIDIAASKGVRFKPGKTLKDALND